MEGSSKRLRKGAWIAEEDNLLRQCIDKYGEGKWHQVPLRAGMFIFNKIRAVGMLPREYSFSFILVVILNFKFCFILSVVLYF